MAKKKEDGAFVSVFKELTTGVLLGSLKTIYENFLETMQDYALKTQRKVMDIFLVFFIFIVAIFMILIAIIFLINQYLQLSFGWSILLVGLFLLIMSFAMKKHIEKSEV